MTDLHRMRYLYALLTLAAIGYLLTGVVPVAPGERAVVRRFGRVLAYKPEPGLWVGLPWGMDQVDRVPVDRVQTVTVGFEDDDGQEAAPPGQLLTGDHNLVNVRASLRYKVIADEVEDYATLGRDRVESLLARAAEAVMAEWLAARKVDDVLLDGKEGLREALVGATPGRVAPYRLGVQILDAQVTLLAPPDDVKPAFESVARAETGRQTRINKAEQEAEANERGARAYEYKRKQEAAAYRDARVLLAQRDAERFLERLKQYEAGLKTNPAYLRQIWEEERGKLFARLKENGGLGLLDHHLGPDGLDITVAPLAPKRP